MCCNDIPHPSLGYGQSYALDCRDLVKAINDLASANPLHPAVIDAMYIPTLVQRLNGTYQCRKFVIVLCVKVM